MAAEADLERASEREWWLRVPLVLQSPRAVFAALRDESEDAARARQEPLTAVVILAGIAGVLSTSVAGRLLDDPALDPLVVAVWAFVGGSFYGLAAYWLGGALVYGAVTLLGSYGSYRRARHLLGYALPPLVLSLLLVWPVRLAVHGSDLFRSGGSDAGGVGDTLAWTSAVFGVWSLGLLVVGVTVVHGWSYARAAAAVALAAAPVALLVLLVWLERYLAGLEL